MKCFNLGIQLIVYIMPFVLSGFVCDLPSFSINFF